MTEREYWYWLVNIKGIGSVKIKNLIDYFKTPKDIYNAKSSILEKVPKISLSNVNAIINSKDEYKIKSRFYVMQQKNIKMILKQDETYPTRLKQIYDPPYALYVRGELPSENKHIISIIGSRECSNYGSQIAKNFAYRLAKENFEIVSGFARGIDTFAHLGALQAQKNTYAILGNGVDICYPKENINTFMEILNNGGLISEFDVGTQPKASNFPLRNRIISGMSDAILLIEAREKSGSLITTDIGLEQGKDIYVIPGRINDELSKGCNNLIKNGAYMVTDVDDILENFSVKITKNTIASVNKANIIDELDDNEKNIYNILSFEPQHIEDIILKTKLDFGEVIQCLFELECKNLIKEVTNNYYALNMI